MDVIERLRADDAVQRLASLTRRDGSLVVRGVTGSASVLIAAALQRIVNRPVLLVTAHLDEADEAADELASFGLPARRFPALETVPGESNVNLELLSERMRLVRAIVDGSAPPIIAAPVHALMQSVPDVEHVGRLDRTLRVGDTLDLREFFAWLERAGYRRVEVIDAPGDFAVRGGIIDLFAPGLEAPVRVDLFGDTVESMWDIDLETMGSDRRIEQAEIISATAEGVQTDEGTTSLLDLLPTETVIVLVEPVEAAEQARGYFERLTDPRGVFTHREVFAAMTRPGRTLIEMARLAPGGDPERTVDLPVESLPPFGEETRQGITDLVTLARDHDVIVFCQNEGEAQRFGELLSEHRGNREASDVMDRSAPSHIVVQVRYLHRGFVWRPGNTGHSTDARPIALVPYHELLHRFQARRRVRRMSVGRAIDTFLDVQVGDYVVHRDHGIARFVDFGPLEGAGVAPSAISTQHSARSTPQEYLTLEFASGARLHVPAIEIHHVQRYIGAFRGEPQLSTLGGKRWKRQKEQVAEAVRDLAEDMIQIQATREAMPGIRFPADTAWQREFEAAFPYPETEDQLAAIAAMKRDMGDERPMDRLVCGDVGFGKTEVAIRGAFKAVEFGKQVAVLVPTTVLAEQHEQTFRGRFADYPFRIESLSRFKTKKEQDAILREVASGRVDIIIGTHRLLSRDVRFADLGLVIIDEEQRFGVEHKNRLLQFRMTADVLTLSATPIPRTLHMSLLGLRDISSLTTPPADRRAIVTEVIPYDERRVKQALERELAREGQVFFVHNRIYNIEEVAEAVQRLVPDARIVIGHGQMAPRQLESVMLRFMRRQADILVSTTIIESGIDIPTANTMIINDADMFGLSELHQLRGRVGRYKHRAYCYLLLPNDRTVTETAVRRLRAIEDYSMLGAGFKIAMRDLEIRGAGNLLGAEQSGHISAVGYEMYCQLLQQAVEQLKQGRPVRRVETHIDLGVTGSLTRHYIPSDLRRLEAYRRLATVETAADLARFEHDLTTAYGDPPRAARVLIDLAALRVAAHEIGIVSIRRHEGDIIFRTARPGLLEERMTGIAGTLRLVGQPDANGLTEVYFRPPPAFLEPGTLLTLLLRRLKGEAGSATSSARAGAAVGSGSGALARRDVATDRPRSVPSRHTPAP